MPGKVYIKTFGCQMNENDSELVMASLACEGYIEVERPEEASLVIVNTCSVREKSHHKAFSTIGEYQMEKGKRPLVVGVIGCVASEEKGEIARKFPSVDFVLGPDQIHRIAEVVPHLKAKENPYVATDFQDVRDYRFPRSFLDQRGEMIKAYVRIMKGCNNKCAFCIVPFVRGPEVSRPSSEIIGEIRGLEGKGVREITLLGQNVNSYGRRLEEKTDFPGLLRRIRDNTGIKRLRFTSPHPKDLSIKLIKEYQKNDILCRHIHLPAQSGSSRILRKMRRAHTREGYLGKVKLLKELCSEISITTDLIVGFPGETEEDFSSTLSLMEEVQFDSCYSFIYSERPGTEASKWKDDVPMEIKKRRLWEVQKLQGEIGLKRNQELVGHVLPVLADTLPPAPLPSREGVGGGGSEGGKTESIYDVRYKNRELAGRTDTNKVVNFVGQSSDLGDTLDIRITRASPYALYGEKVDA